MNQDKMKRVISDFLSGKTERQSVVPDPLDEVWKHKLKTHIALKDSYLDRFHELDRIADKVYKLPSVQESEKDVAVHSRFMQAAFSEDLFNSVKAKEKRLMKGIHSHVIEKFLRGDD